MDEWIWTLGLGPAFGNSRLAIVDAGHFVWEEAAGEYASIVSDWVMGGYRDAAGTAHG